MVGACWVVLTRNSLPKGGTAADCDRRWKGAKLHRPQSQRVTPPMMLLQRTGAHGEKRRPIAGLLSESALCRGFRRATARTAEYGGLERSYGPTASAWPGAARARRPRCARRDRHTDR